ncbi:unnamed protein product [Psylliodes chrysocephalus]|uniref:Uncharacterized protein n=1 Tax=Psylliodes chrysocephalus TaxID=3402493 RepID=A0A9P0CRW0_9CUCU|nr:unnamed protein product [Psylliodes chrysocephala]
MNPNSRGMKCLEMVFKPSLPYKPVNLPSNGLSTSKSAEVLRTEHSNLKSDELDLDNIPILIIQSDEDLLPNGDLIQLDSTVEYQHLNAFMLEANNYQDVQKLDGILAEHNFPEAGDLEIEKNVSEQSQKVIEDENITEENNNYKESSETAFVPGKCDIQTKYQKAVEVDDENEIENEIKYSDESSGSEYVPEDRGNQSKDQSKAEPRVEQSENENQDVEKKIKRVRRCQVNELKWSDRMNRLKRESGQSYLGRKRIENNWRYDIEKPPKEMKVRCDCHTQMEVDSVHSTIERKIKKKNINVPADYINICETACKIPYTVKYLDYHTFFKRMDILKFYKSIRPGNTVGDPHVTDLKQIKYTKDGIFYKLRYSDEVLNVTRNNKIEMRPFEEMPPLYNERIKISSEKYNHLQVLKKSLLPDYHLFYDNLPHV